MGINNDYPVLNGIAPSWADIIFTASPAGAPVLVTGDIKAVKRKRTVTIGEKKGASGGRVMKRTTGSIKYELSVQVYQDGYQKFLRGLTAVAPTRGNQSLVRFVHFGVQVQFTPFNDPEIYDWRAKGVCLIGDSFDSAEGEAANEVELTFSAIEIVDMIDGKEVLYL